MHNIKLIRKNSEFYLKKFKERNINFSLEKFLELDKKNRELIQKKETLEQEKKIISQKKDSTKFSKSKEISNEIDILTESQSKVGIEIENIINTRIIIVICPLSIY